MKLSDKLIMIFITFVISLGLGYWWGYAVYKKPVFVDKVCRFDGKEEVCIYYNQERKAK